MRRSLTAAAVLAAATAVPAPASAFTACVTNPWFPLLPGTEPGVRDRKWYERGIGQVAEITLRGGDEQAALVSFTRG